MPFPHTALSRHCKIISLRFAVAFACRDGRLNSTLGVRQACIGAVLYVF
jgi:hypothetical protein